MRGKRHGRQVRRGDTGGPRRPDWPHRARPGTERAEGTDRAGGCLDAACRTLHGGAQARLPRVLPNMVRNVFRNTPEGGRITVRRPAPRRRARGERDGFRSRHGGGGGSSVFDRFSWGPAEERDSGSGLDLAICCCLPALVARLRQVNLRTLRQLRCQELPWRAACS